MTPRGLIENCFCLLESFYQNLRYHRPDDGENHNHCWKNLKCRTACVYHGRSGISIHISVNITSIIILHCLLGCDAVRNRRNSRSFWRNFRDFLADWPSAYFPSIHSMPRNLKTQIIHSFNHSHMKWPRLQFIQFNFTCLIFPFFSVRSFAFSILQNQIFDSSHFA
jgi:hypothetical protein